MEYDPIKDKLFALTKNSVRMRDLLFFAIGHVFLREAHVKRRIKLAGIPETASILDAGCGLGQYSLWLAKHFPHSQIFAGDVKQHFIDAGNTHAKAKGYHHLKFGELDLLKLEDQSKYDFVVSVDVLEHIEDDVDLMTRYRKALKPNGILIVHSPGADEDSRLTAFDPKHQVEEHVRVGYLPAELEEKLHTAGFDQVEIYHTYHPVTGLLLWRMWQQVPLLLSQLSYPGMALIPFWMLIAYPLGYPLWWRDLHIHIKHGKGVLAVARKAG